MIRRCRKRSPSDLIFVDGPIRDICDVEVMASLDEKARENLELPQLIADALIGEMISGYGKGVDTTGLSIEAGSAIEGDETRIGALRRRAREGLSPDLSTANLTRRPFNWPLEFPEVLNRGNGGFDAIVGTPPYMGGRVISSNTGHAYYRALDVVRNFVSGSPDLAVFFLLRAFSLLRQSGCLGFVTTSAIKDTGNKEVGFDQIIAGGGEIYYASPSSPWPGSASVIVSVFSIFKGSWGGSYKLADAVVPFISSGLDSIPHFQIRKLRSMRDVKSDGFKLMGEGFVLSESETKEIRIKDANPDEIIRPYFGGDDIVELPTLKPYRWVIDFEDKSVGHAAQWSYAFDRVVREVKPFRDGQTGQIHQDCFWKFWDMRPKLRKAQKQGEHYLIMPAVSKYIVLRRYVGKAGFNQKTKAVFFSDHSSFGVLQSNIHDIWARWRSGSRGIGLSYSTSKALDTFPMPERKSDALEKIGQLYYEQRQKILTDQKIGPTELYNRVHNDEVVEEHIQDFRLLIQELDKAVVDEYGWDDMQLRHGFYDISYLPESDRRRFYVCEES